MSESAQPAAPWAPKQVAAITFSKDFKPLTDDAGEDVGAVLGTLERLSEMSANSLKLGTVRALNSWGGGEGFRYIKGREGVSYERFDGVTDWYEIDSELVPDPQRQASGTVLPLFPQRQELVELLKESNLVQWFGIRNGSNNTWNVEPKRSVVDRENIKRTCQNAFQMDVILNAQQYPRSRMGITFEDSRLWAVQNDKGDMLVMLSEKTKSPHQQRVIVELSKAFPLT